MKERDPFQPALEWIHAKLEQLHTLDLTYQIVGAKTHRYRLKPCLEASRIEALERRYEMHLPEEYRRFLQEVGNGEAGSDHGFFSLEQSLKMVASDALQRLLCPNLTRRGDSVSTGR